MPFDYDDLFLQFNVIIILSLATDVPLLNFE